MLFGEFDTGIKYDGGRYYMNKLQSYTNDILLYFAEFCEKNEIKYFLAGGTLLGAVRHDGFIPWDDDIDIAMPRGDFEKLISMRSEFDGRYILRYYRWDPDAYYSFLKVEDTQTTKIENVNDQFYYSGGVAIDIFPQDGLPRKKHKMIIKFYEILFLMRNYKRLIRPKSKFFLFCKIASRVLFGITSFDKIVACYAKKYPYEKCEYVRSFCGLYGEKETYRRELFGEGCLHCFEGREYPIPQHYHEYLTQMYGDYMKLPSEENRVSNHSNEVIDLHVGYKEQSNVGVRK